MPPTPFPLILALLLTHATADTHLFSWETAMKVCPEGWHLPTNEEWDRLFRFVDGDKGTESPYKSKTAGSSASDDKFFAAYIRIIDCFNANVYWSNEDKYRLFSVRCLKD